MMRYIDRSVRYDMGVNNLAILSAAGILCPALVPSFDKRGSTEKEQECNNSDILTSKDRLKYIVCFL